MKTTRPQSLLSRFAMHVVLSAAFVWTAAVAVVRAQPTEPPRPNLQLWLKADAGVTADANGAVTAWATMRASGIRARLRSWSPTR